jgi:ketosteroid isomerase-like protein
MAPDTNVEIFRRVIEAFNRDGVDGVLPYYTDDAEVYDPDLPPGTYRGREAVSRVIEMMTSGFEDVEILNFQLLPAGARVVALLHTQSRGERDDLAVETRDAHTITFRDGKITYWRVYLDQAEALQDAGLDPELGRPASPEVA